MKTQDSSTSFQNDEERNDSFSVVSGDMAFIYHAGKERSIVGVAQITSPAYPDPKPQNTGQRFLKWQPKMNN